MQSALSQQLQRLERELGVCLLERSTHRVRLTREGSAFLIEARQILAHIERAVDAAKRGSDRAPALRVGTVDPSYDSMPQILRRVQARCPELEINQVEGGVPQQVRMLIEGRLDVGFGRAAQLPLELASELIRLDPMGVLVPEDHGLAALPSVPVATLAEAPLLFHEEERAPEFNEFLHEMYRVARCVPTTYMGTVASVVGAHALVKAGRCVLCAPASCAAALPGVVWRPLTEPAARYPWSVFWRAGDQSRYVRAVIACARVLAAEHDWLYRSQPGALQPVKGGVAVP